MQIITADELIKTIIDRDRKIELTKIELVKYWYEQGRDLIRLRDELNCSFDDLPKIVGISKSSIYNYVAIGRDERISKLVSISNGGKIEDTKYIEQFNQKQIVKLSTLNDVEFMEALQNGKLPNAKSDKPLEAELTISEEIEHKQEQIKELQSEIEVLQSEVSSDDTIEVLGSHTVVDVEVIEEEIPTKKPNNQEKPVKQLIIPSREIKEMFSSLSDASSKTGFSSSSISKCCTGKQKKAHGYQWEYVNQ